MNDNRRNVWVFTRNQLNALKHIFLQPTSLLKNTVLHSFFCAILPGTRILIQNLLNPVLIYIFTEDQALYEQKAEKGF